MVQKVFISLSLLLLCSCVAAQKDYVLGLDSWAEIKGTSTLHDWTCKVLGLSFNAQLIQTKGEEQKLSFQNINLQRIVLRVVGDMQ